MEDLFFPLFLQIYTRRAWDSEYIIGGKNGWKHFSESCFWATLAMRPSLAINEVMNRG